MPKFETSGEKLFKWILTRYSSMPASDCWLGALAQDFDMERLEAFLLRSTALMILRRLIWNAAWYVEKYPSPEILAVVELFESLYLRKSFGFTRDESRQLGRLTFDALKATQGKISPSMERRLRQAAANGNERCHLCGHPIDYENPSDDRGFSLDHRWPRSLGGESEEWNLHTTHRVCNSRCQDIVDECDIHYEHFHVKAGWSPDKNASFWKELNWSFRFGALFQANFQCEVCSNPLQIHEMEDDLYFSVRNRDENLNMFNVQVTCGKHKRLPDVETS